jgi:hypothetical protein
MSINVSLKNRELVDLGETTMEDIRKSTESALFAESNRLAKLICKLRWIGMEEEARRLQMAERLSMKRWDVIAVEPINTD